MTKKSVAFAGTTVAAAFGLVGFLVATADEESADPERASFNRLPPENQLRSVPVDGLVSSTTARQAALTAARVAGEKNAAVSDLRLLSYADARTHLGLSSINHSIGRISRFTP